MATAPTHRSQRLDAADRDRAQALMDDLERSAGRAMAIRTLVLVAAVGLVLQGARTGSAGYAIGGGVLSIGFFWLWRVGSGEWSQLKRDLRVGQKIETVMHLSDRYIDQRDTAAYVLVLNGQAVDVTRRMYDSVRAGGDLLVTALPYSGTVLSVQPIP